jgi:hypothetical protein
VIAPLPQGTERDERGRRRWTPQERFVAITFRRLTGMPLAAALADGDKVVVDMQESGIVRGFAVSVGGGEPFVFVVRPFQGTPVGEYIRDQLLRGIGQ